jgi:hypothetical protein
MYVYICICARALVCVCVCAHFVHYLTTESRQYETPAITTRDCLFVVYVTTLTAVQTV